MLLTCLCVSVVVFMPSKISCLGINSLSLVKEEKAVAFDDMACTNENQTYTVDLKIHSQDSVVKAIHSIAGRSIDSRETESEAIESYFGTIIDELNEYLIRFKVQIHINLDGYDSDDFMGNVAFDMSCEKSSPVVDRTSSAFSFLKQSFNDNIGLHLFVWGCTYISSLAELETVYSNLRCGRVMGVMWKGSGETRDLIKSVILNALTGNSNVYSPENGDYNSSIGPNLCKYVTSCIGMDKSEIGQLVQGTEVIKYTDIDSESSWIEDEIHKPLRSHVHVH